MKYCMFFISFLTLSGCVIAPPVKIVGANIGVLTLDLDANELCHEYEGFKGKKDYVYPVKLDIDSNYQLATKKAIELSGNNYVNLGNINKSDSNSYFIRVKWDHSLEFTPEGMEYINRIKNENQVDYIVLPWAVSSDKNCFVKIRRGLNLRGKSDGLLERNFSINVQLHILKTDPVNHIGPYWFGGNYDDTIFITTINELDPKEIEFYTDKAIKSFGNQFQLKLEGNGK